MRARVTAHPVYTDALEEVTAMKKWPACAVLFALTLAGCSGTENYFSMSTELNRPMFAPVGEALIRWEEGVRETGSREPSEAIRYELLYAGLSGRTVNITYREYWTSPSKKLIQPVFNQELKYELGQDGKAIITFKEIRIEVAEASSERISFHVTNGPAGAQVETKQGRTRSEEKPAPRLYPN